MRPTTLCKLCNKKVTNNNYPRHSASCIGVKKKKIRGIDFDPNWGYEAGVRSTWNKGLRSKPDTRNPDYVGSHGGYRANSGRSKKFKVMDSFGKEVCLQSTYELRCSEILDELKINWVRPKALKYDDKRYFADFYLPDHAVYLDPKNNYKAKLDREKIDMVVKQNKVKVVILLETDLTIEFIQGLCS